MTPTGPSDWFVFFPQPEQPLMGPLRASAAIFEYVPVQKCGLTGKSVQWRDQNLCPSAWERVDTQALKHSSVESCGQYPFYTCLLLGLLGCSRWSDF